MTTLHAGGEVKLHVVAQVVETEFVVRAVGDVGGVSCLPFEVIHVVLNTADFESEKTMDLAHPLGVAGGEVVVHSYDVNAAASGQRIQIRRQSSDESFALAGAHLGNLSLVENDAADQLHVEMANASGRSSSRISLSRTLRRSLSVISATARWTFSLNVAVRARSSSSDSFCTDGSREFIFSTIGWTVFKNR